LDGSNLERPFHGNFGGDADRLLLAELGRMMAAMI
jgi:hypothetical protein